MDIQGSGMNMNDDAWNLFAELCQKVVEEQNVFLDVIVTPGMIEMMLLPIEEDEEE